MYTIPASQERLDTMLFTREFDYALRILRRLSAQKVVSIGNIVQCEHLTRAIAYKVARKLNQGGLIGSQRGTSGGYLLSRGLEEISLYDVFRVIEPDTMITECMLDGYTCPMNNAEKPCSMHCAFVTIQERLFNELQQLSLEDILGGQHVSED